MPIEDALRDALEALVQRLRGSPFSERVRWVPPENLHLTLRFLGKTPAARIDPLLEALRLALARVDAFSCHARRLELFPSARRPRIVAATLDASDRLSDLARRAESASIAAGFTPEHRRFRAHVTLGRVRRAPLTGVSLSEEVNAPRLPVRHVVLFESDLAPGGARYSELARIALGSPTEAAPGSDSTP